jgi:hypothetical protein
MMSSSFNIMASIIINSRPVHSIALEDGGQSNGCCVLLPTRFNKMVPSTAQRQHRIGGIDAQD